MSSSHVDKSIVSEDASEESGWTAYFEDFSLKNQNENISSCSSLVSDAAWNGFDAYYNNVNHVKRLNFKNSNKKSNFKKHSYDDDLEDTASSPVNSPKVSTLRQMEVNYKRTNELTFGDFLPGKANNLSEIGRDIEKNNGKNIIVESRNKNEFVELKKRGLCLVPMSTLINYIG